MHALGHLGPEVAYEVGDAADEGIVGAPLQLQFRCGVRAGLMATPRRKRIGGGPLSRSNQAAASSIRRPGASSIRFGLVDLLPLLLSRTTFLPAVRGGSGEKVKSPASNVPTDAGSSPSWPAVTVIPPAVAAAHTYRRNTRIDRVAEVFLTASEASPQDTSPPW